MFIIVLQCVLMTMVFSARCHFVFTALKSHGNPDVCSDLVELKIKGDLP